MTYLFPERIKRPRILLVDFAVSDAEELGKDGYNAISARTGLADGQREFPCVPSEVDIAFVNAELSTVSVYEEPTRNLPPGYSGPGGIKLMNGDLAGKAPMTSVVMEIIRKKGWVVFFVGRSAQPYLDRMLPFAIKTGRSHGLKATGYQLDLPIDGDDAASQVANIINLAKHQMLPLYSLSNMPNSEEGIDWVCTNLLTSESYVPAAYSTLIQGTTFHRDPGSFWTEHFGHVLLLPRFKDNILVAKQLLTTAIAGACPAEMFPGKRPVLWAQSHLYSASPVISLVNQFERLKSQHDAEELQLAELVDKTAEEFRFLQQALIADDDPDHFSGDGLLSPNVQLALELLGFAVTPQDPEREASGESKHEDLHIKDPTDSYFALTEVKGTERGSKANWLMQWHKHYRQYTLKNQKTAPGDIKGLIIANYERSTEPAKRSPFFHANPDSVQEAVQSQVSLLSTWELFKICNAVLSGKLAKNDARELIKRPGVVSYIES